MSFLPSTFAGDVVPGPTREQLEAFLDEHRGALDGCLDGLSEEQARRSMVASRTTLLGLVKHATFVEKVWFDEAVTCRSRVEIGIPATPDESFILDDDDTIATIQGAHREACESSRRARRRWRWRNCSAATDGARSRCTGCTSTSWASSPSTVGTPTSCASSSSTDRRDRAAGGPAHARPARSR